MVILFTGTKNRLDIMQTNLAKNLIVIIIFFILISQINITSIPAHNSIMDEYQTLEDNDLKDEMNFLCFVRLGLVDGAYCYTVPYIIFNLLEYTNIQQSSPKLSNFLQIVGEIILEIEARNPFIFPHSLTYVVGKGRIHTFGLLGHGIGGSWGYGIAEFRLYGFTGIRVYTKDNDINMIGWALFCTY